MPAPTITASSSAEWVLTEAAHEQIGQIDAVFGAGEAKRRLQDAAEAKRRLSQGWRSAITPEKLARAEDLPPQIDLRSCRHWGQVSGLIAECGEELSLGEMNMLSRFAAIWAEHHNRRLVINRYCARIQVSHVGYSPEATKLEKLRKRLRPAMRDRVDDVGRLLNSDGRGWLRTDDELRRRERRLRAEEQRFGLPANSLPLANLFDPDQIEVSRKSEQEFLSRALREFAAHLLRVLEEYPEEKLLPEYNENAA